jgi:hypothetical protein
MKTKNFTITFTKTKTFVSLFREKRKKTFRKNTKTKIFVSTLSRTEDKYAAFLICAGSSCFTLIVICFHWRRLFLPQCKLDFGLVYYFLSLQAYCGVYTNTPCTPESQDGTASTAGSMAATILTRSVSGAASQLTSWTSS